MANLPVGAWIRRHIEMICKDCLKTGEWPPGEVTEDGMWEVRSCPNPRCPGTWRARAMYVAGPGTATEPNAFE
ncbi:hypothetical protein [Streptomyces mobaraensis]|uniref:hypothetical protein n=1 Tax=Streptomyces mobaraensis TaxID=35621 RepID=UPI001F0427AD|nr:hypothetical protein [Streptomyces mobaraensis]